MKILQKHKIKDTQFNYSMLKLLLKDDNLRLVSTKDLKIGLQYIHINKNLLFSQYKSKSYQLQTITNQRTKQSAIDYTKYKNSIKRLVKEKELWTKIIK